MSKEKQPLRTSSAQVNLLPGFGVLALSVAATAIGLTLGARLMPFGGVAIAACLFSAAQMVQRRSVVPGYVSFFVAVPAIAAATFLPF